MPSKALAAIHIVLPGKYAKLSARQDAKMRNAAIWASVIRLRAENCGRVAERP